MSDFWNNVSRYPRFFVSSLFGSFLVILAPLKSLFKTPKLRSILIILLLCILLLLYIVIRQMTGL